MPPRFAWQAQHSEHLRLVLCGRRSTWSTSSWSCVAGAALEALQGPFVWQAQHLEHFRLLLRVRRSTWSTFIEVGGSLATSDANGRRLVLHGRRSTRSTSGSFCVAGVALGALEPRFAWQVRIDFFVRGRGRAVAGWAAGRLAGRGGRVAGDGRVAGVAGWPGWPDGRDGRGGQVAGVAGWPGLSGGRVGGRDGRAAGVVVGVGWSGNRVQTAGLPSACKPRRLAFRAFGGSGNFTSKPVA